LSKNDQEIEQTKKENFFLFYFVASFRYKYKPEGTSPFF